MRVDFGREVTTDRIEIYTRADFPHDAWWTKATVRFSDDTTMVCDLVKTDEGQEFTFPPKKVRWVQLEELINRTNEQYREKGLALIQKIPTPITPIKIDKEKHHITLAYFDQKSTVDYIGAVQGIPVCFDAKECAADTFALQNLSLIHI